MESEKSPAAPQELNPIPSAAAERKQRESRKRSAIMTALRLDGRSTRPVGVERLSRRAMLMSMARRAVSHAMEEPRSLSGRLQRDYLVRRWKNYTSALANRTGWRF